MKGRGVYTDLNITPLIDVALVLLIIFMAVTPAAQQFFEVGIPPEAGPDVPRPARDVPVVALAADGSLTLGGAPVTLDLLPGALRMRGTTTGETVLFRADDAASYERAIDVLDRIRTSGAAIGIVTASGSPP